MARSRLWLGIIGATLIVVAGLFIYYSLQSDDTTNNQSSLIGDEYELPRLGFEQVDGNYDWSFPQDEGVHPAFQRETWQLNTSDDCAYDLDLSFNLLNILPADTPLDRSSNWQIESVMTGQLVIRQGDEAIYEHIADSRVALDLAGATGERVWIENWSLNLIEHTITVQGVDLNMNLDLELGDPIVQDSAEWYSYRRDGQVRGQFSQGENRYDLNCDAQFTHRFGSP